MSKQQRIILSIPLDTSNPKEKKVFNIWKNLDRQTLTSRIKPAVLKIVLSCATSIIEQCADKEESEQSETATMPTPTLPA